MKCNGDCFNCEYDDCILDFSEEEQEELEELAKKMDQVRKTIGSRTPEYNRLYCRRRYILNKEKMRSYQREYQRKYRVPATKVEIDGFNDRLDNIICESGKSLNVIAKESGIDRKALLSYRAGVTLPNAKSLYKICKYFNVSADYLLFGEVR